MNILIISFSTNGAMGDNFKIVTKYLAQKKNVSVLTNTNIKDYELGTNKVCHIRFDRHRPLDFINPFNYYKIYAYIRKSNFDIVFILSHHPINLFIYHIIDNNKIVVYLHDHEIHSGVSGLDLFFHKKALAYYYNKSQKIIVSSFFMKSEIQKKRKIKSDKIEVNYLGLLENHIKNNIKNNEPSDIDVLFFGRLEYYKGLDILINAFRKLSSTVSGVIISKGSIETVFGIKKLPTNIRHIAYYVSDEELALYIQKSKIIVLPYRDATGTQTIQSAFFYSKPVIASDVGCFPEYIESGKDGIIVPKENPQALADAIKYLLSNDSLRITMGENGRRKINTIFSNSHINDKYIEIFESMIDKKSE